MKNKKTLIIISVCVSLLAVGGILTYLLWPTANYISFNNLNVVAYNISAQPLVPPTYANPVIHKNFNDSTLLPYTSISIVPKGDHFIVYKPKKITFEVHCSSKVTLTGSVSFVMGQDLPLDAVIAANSNVKFSFKYNGNQAVDEIKIYFAGNTKNITVFNTRIEVE